MEIVYESKGHIEFFDDEKEYTHAPTNDELWQESFVVYFWDTERNAYAFIRIAQTPNYKGGTAQIMLNVWTPECFYKHTDDLVPFDGSGRTQKNLTIGDDLVSYAFDGNFNWTINDPEYGVTADLVFKGYHKGISFFPGDNAFTKKMLSNHSQAFGSVEGTLCIKGKQYDISGHGWRDHSHGHRRWLGVRGHRFFPFIFNKDFYCTNSVAMGQDGKLSRSSVLVHNGKMIYTDDFDAIAYMGADGISTHGGQLRYNAEGEKRVFDYEPIAPPSVIMVHGMAMTEGMCRVKWGDQEGIGHVETTTNPFAGKERPFICPPGIVDNGLHPLD